MNSEKVLGASEVALLVNQILETFLQLRLKKKKRGKDILEFLRLDIKLLKGENEYSLQVSNCGTWDIEYIEEILKLFNQFCAKLDLKNENYLYRGEPVYTENEVSLKASNEEGETVEFPHLKEYLCIKLKPKINFSDLRDFEETVLRKISFLKDSNLNVKFTYFRDEKILYNNRVELDKDYEYSCLLSSALTKIVKQSQREEFRKQSFALFGVENCKNLELAIKSILLPKIHSNYEKLTIQKLRDCQGSEKYF